MRIFLGWARNVKKRLDFRIFPGSLVSGFGVLTFRCFCYSVFAPVGGCANCPTLIFLSRVETFFQCELSCRVVAFLVGHGMRTRFRVPTERGRRLARPTSNITEFR